MNTDSPTLSLHALNVTLGLEPDATEAHALAVLREERAFIDRFLEKMGATTVSAAIARLQELTAVADRVCAATRQETLDDAALAVTELVAGADALAKTHAIARTERVDALLTKARASGKISDGEIHGEHGLRALGHESPERLEHMLKMRPPNAALALHALKTPPRKYEELTSAERVAMASDDVATFAALRSDWEARGKPAGTN